MKTTAIACAVLAGSFGFGSLAVAQDGRRDRDGDRGERFEQRHDRREARHDRHDRREDRRDFRQERRELQQQRAYRNGYVAGAYGQPNYGYSQPGYVYSQPGYGYSQPRHSARWQRGGYLPYEYRSNAYYVNNWNSHPGLHAPPYGHQWVNVGSDYLLVALATGLIANLLVN